MAEFGDAPSALSSNISRLRRALPREDHVVELLMAARSLHLHALGSDIERRPLFADDRAVQRYLFAHMAHEPAEQARVLHLNAKNRLIREDVFARGTVDRVNISTRELVRRALDLGTTAMILAHNHPSGDPTPSGSDLTITRDISQAAKLFDIRLLDHIIVARSGCYSFRASGRL